MTLSETFKTTSSKQLNGKAEFSLQIL